MPHTSRRSIVRRAPLVGVASLVLIAACDQPTRPADVPAASPRPVRVAAPSYALAPISSITLTDLPSLGANGYSRPWEINYGGEMAAGAAFPGLPQFWPSVRSAAGVWAQVGLPGGTAGEAKAINASGVAVGLVVGVGYFIYTPGLGSQPIVHSPTSSVAAINDINDSGVAVGQCFVPLNPAPRGEYHACRWLAPTTSLESELGALPLLGTGSTVANSSTANAINSNGDMAGWTDSRNSTTGAEIAHAVLWSSAGVATDLGTLPGDACSYAIGINDVGQVVGFSALGPVCGAPANGKVHESFSSGFGATFRAFIWSATTGMQALGSLDGNRPTVAFAINNQGIVVGHGMHSITTPNGSTFVVDEPFVWTPVDGMRDLGITGAPANVSTSGVAFGINDRSQIVGTGSITGRGILWTLAFSNTPPTSNPGGTYSGVEGAAIAMNGSASNDPDSDPLTFAWNFGDGQTGSGASPSHTYADNGTYTVTLTVSDGRGGVTAATTSATVTNAAPSVNAGADGALAQGGTFSMTATLSDAGAADGPWSYSVDWGDSSSPSTGTLSVLAPAPALTHVYAAAGSFTATLTVTDKDAAAGTDAVAVVVTANNRPPVAVANGPYTGQEGVAVSFSATGSSDADADALTYAWDFGDGASASGASASHAYGNQGAYTVTLTVSDGRGGSNAATAAATISNVAPNATLAAAPLAVPEGTPFSLQFTNVQDVVGDLAQIQFAYRCQTGGSLSSFGTASSSNCVPTDNGIWTGGGSVRDGDGGQSNYSAQAVTVSNVAPSVTATAFGSANLGVCRSGAIATLEFRFTDPGAADSPWTYSVYWGDGNGNKSKPETGNLLVQGAVVRVPHTFTTKGKGGGTFAAFVDVRDKDGGTGRSATVQFICAS